MVRSIPFEQLTSSFTKISFSTDFFNSRRVGRTHLRGDEAARSHPIPKVIRSESEKLLSLEQICCKHKQTYSRCNRIQLAMEKFSEQVNTERFLVV